MSDLSVSHWLHSDHRDPQFVAAVRQKDDQQSIIVREYRLVDEKLIAVANVYRDLLHDVYTGCGSNASAFV